MFLADQPQSPSGSIDADTRPGSASSGRRGRSDSGATSRWRARRAYAGVLLVGGLLAPALLVAGVASAAPKPTVAEITKQVRQLQSDAEVATERYNAANEQFASVQVRLAAAKARTTQQVLQVERARKALGLVAAQMYRAGDLATLSLFFSDDPDTFLAQNGVVATLTDRQAAAITQLQSEERRLQADQNDVAQQQARVAATRNALAGQRKVVLAKLAAATTLLNKLTAQQRAAMNVPGGSAKPGETCDQAGVVPPNARVAKVLAYACSKLGDPYIWGAPPPSGGFDCSGLTMMAWAQAGVSLPHNAAQQYSMGTSVSSSDIQPGDLLFFHGPQPSHVGIAIGHGLMIHAPHSGDVVKIAPIESGLIGIRRY